MKASPVKKVPVQLRVSLPSGFSDGRQGTSPGGVAGLSPFLQSSRSTELERQVSLPDSARKYSGSIRAESALQLQEDSPRSDRDSFRRSTQRLSSRHRRASSAAAATPTLASTPLAPSSPASLEAIDLSSTLSAYPSNTPAASPLPSEAHPREDNVLDGSERPAVPTKRKVTHAQDTENAAPSTATSSQTAQARKSKGFRSPQLWLLFATVAVTGVGMGAMLGLGQRSTTESRLRALPSSGESIVDISCGSDGNKCKALIQGAGEQFGATMPASTSSSDHFATVQLLDETGQDDGSQRARATARSEDMSASSSTSEEVKVLEDIKAVRLKQGGVLSEDFNREVAAELQLPVAVTASPQQAYTVYEKKGLLRQYFGVEFVPPKDFAPLRVHPMDGTAMINLPGTRFAIRGRKTLMNAFVSNLADVHDVFVMDHDNPGYEEQLRREVLFQYGVATPGLGKTTFMKEGSSWLTSEHLSASNLSPTFKRRMETFREKRLFFNVDFSLDPPCIQEFENIKQNKTRLAARLLHSTFDRKKLPFSDFITKFHQDHPALLAQLTPDDVLRFIWSESGLESDALGTVVFGWDEASMAEGYVQTLMSTYLESVLLPGRFEGADHTQSPHFVAMVLGSTRVDVANLKSTSSGRAQSKPLPFTLLEQEDAEFVVLDFMRRLGVPATTIPSHVKVVVDMLGGNPRLLERMFACMSGRPTQQVDVAALIDYWHSDGALLERVVQCTADRGLVRFDEFFDEHKPKAELLQVVHDDSVLNQRVTRGDNVKGTSFTYGDLENAGMVALVDPGLATTGTPSAAMMLPRNNPLHLPLVVRIPALVAYKFREKTGEFPCRVLGGVHHLDPSEKEEGDIEMVMERCRAMRNRGQETCLVEEVYGRPLSPSNPHRNLVIRVPKGNYGVQFVSKAVPAGELKRQLYAASKGGPWAFCGHGSEEGPDCWLMFSDISDKPFIDYHQSKSTIYLGQGTITAAKVAKEYRKLLKAPDKWPVDVNHIFVLITDERITDAQYKLAVATPEVEVVGFDDHKKFYGSEGSSLRHTQVLSRYFQLQRRLTDPTAPPPPPKRRPGRPTKAPKLTSAPKPAKTPKPPKVKKTAKPKASKPTKAPISSRPKSTTAAIQQ